jgi:diguanylate cyclase (GGDEF)-like protein
MLFIDMDHFKDINDTLGHPVGDGLLVEVGQRLSALVRDSDIVARLGGDEFVLVLTGTGQDAARAAAAVAAKVLAELGRPYTVRGHELHSTPSIGIALFPADGEDADTLMKNADAAMYHAKAAGRNNAQCFTPAMNQATQDRLALEAGLRGAIERGELFLNYQPQLDLASRRIVGLEALVRWRHPEMGLIAPLKFIPVAEDTGQIEAIGAWVLEEALRQVALWRAAGHADLCMAVNLSAHQLRGDAFPEHVSQALHRHGLPGSALELEITESVAMRDPARTAALLRQLRQFGVALAIDDFGTGYSSLAYLKQLPLSCLKLDRSFVMDIETDANDAAICTATIQMAHSLGLGVVAEGVETATQLEFLRRLGCDTVQGYFIARPLSAADCTAFLGRHTPAEAAVAA